MAKVFAVFYRDYVNDVVIPSSRPEELDAARIRPLAEQLLQHADNFLGIVDASDLILHAYLDDSEQRVTLELLYPESGGAMRLTLEREAALHVLADLPLQFDEKLLPGAQYVS